MTAGLTRPRHATRRLESDRARAAASGGLQANLQAALVDLIELELQAKHAHWNVVGADFKAVHELLDTVVDTARSGADTIAERMRALQAVPDGRSTTVASATHLPLMTAGPAQAGETARTVAGRIATAVGTLRAIRDAVDAEDPSTTDLLHGLVIDLEKDLWMLAAAAQ